MQRQGRGLQANPCVSGVLTSQLSLRLLTQLCRVRSHQMLNPRPPMIPSKTSQNPSVHKTAALRRQHAAVSNHHLLQGAVAAVGGHFLHGCNGVWCGEQGKHI